MEMVYLLFSVVSSAITSAFLSLRLALRCLLAPSTDFTPPTDEDSSSPQPLWLYEGHVRHVRRSPRHHAFEYLVRYALVDLDRASSTPPSALPPFILPPSFFAGHLSPDEARAAAGTNGPVLLLTIPPSVGYEQNPLSVYYCYDVDAVPATTQQQIAGSNSDERSATTPIRLKKCIAEVTNTPWGERVSFVFDPTSDLVAKPLHVSPFMDMLGNWNIRAGEPGGNLFVGISIQHPEMGNYFTATLAARRVSMHSFAPSPLGPAFFFWFMPQRVALWIYWQALKLWWRNVPFIQHPRYSNPTYREDALLRDMELRCPSAKERNGNAGHRHSDDESLLGSTDRKGNDRWCVWRNAEWPWS
ncbi:hypothetical protein Taro_030886 [Colocasia esculenta]|uniref:Uncharacterized protein n=1 Tax=Colocasia esculenta TaxID=4460 RepID=A0A843VMH7_COLES|nr:hypothetical protein [Colocasia esculenta]